MSEPESSDLDPDLRLRLSQPMLDQSLRPVADEQEPGGTLVMDEREQQQVQERDAATAGARLPKHMSGPQEWVLLPLSDAPEGVIGVGGEGVVYSYVQRELGREVAVKTLRADRWSYDAIESLLREACVTARLEHPNIVPVHYLHLPEHDGDSPYWVMKRVRGKPLTEHLPGAKDPWPVDRLLDVFRRVLDAVAFAHSKGIVHRDLKPDNVLVGEFGEVQVTDWGLAVAINEEGARGASPLLEEHAASGGECGPPQEDAEGSAEISALSGDLARLNESVRSGRVGALLNSSAGGRAGTPVYMAPEQLDLVAGNVDERTDVFLLGGVLYAMLTGQAPHQLEDGDDTRVAQQRLAQIRSCSTVRPVTDVRREHGLLETPEGLSEAALTGLWDITKKALSPGPGDRFGGVAAFETTLDEWESQSTSQELSAQASARLDEVASHRRPSARGYAEVIALADASLDQYPENEDAQRLREQASAGLVSIQRQSTRRLWTAFAASVLVVFAGGHGWIQYLDAQAQRTKAENLARSEARQRVEAVAAKEGAERARDEEKRARLAEAEQRRKAENAEKEANTERDKALREAYFANIALAEQKIHDTDISDAERLLDACPEHLRSWEWGHLKRLCHLEILTLRGHNSIVFCVAFDPDGQRIASGSEDGLKVWDVASGREVLTPRGHGSAVTSVAFSPDGQRIASGSADETVKVWDAANGREVLTLRGHDSYVHSVAFRFDGQRIASGSEDKTVKVWDAVNGREVLTFRGHSSIVSCVTFSPDGQRIASGSEDKTVKVWDAANGREVLTLRGHDSCVCSVAFSPDGRRIASGSVDHVVKVWDAANSREVLMLGGHDERVASVAFSPDGQRIASASWDRTVKVWNAASGREILTLRGHHWGVCCVAFSPDSQRIASGSGDKTVKVWDVASSREATRLRGHSSSVHCVALSPDGQRIASGSRDNTVKIWDVASSREVLTLRGHDSGVHSVAFSPDGRRIASGSGDEVVKIWDAASGREVLTLRGHGSYVHSVAFSPDGQRIAAGSRAVKVWDAASGHELMTLRAHGRCSVAFGPGGQRIASGGERNTVKVWDAVSGRVVLTLKGHDRQVNSVAFSPEGQRIASGSYDRAVKIWDAAGGREVFTLRGHDSPVHSVAFSPDGQRIASGSADKTVKVWDAASGRELARLRGHSSSVNSVAFSLDWQCIASGSSDSTVMVWHGTPALNANQFLAGAQEGQGRALYHLALIREREQNDAEARRLHLRGAAATEADQKEWAEKSSSRLAELPWLQSWWRAYQNVVSLLESGQFDAGMTAYRCVDVPSASSQHRLAMKLADRLVEIARERGSKKDYGAAIRLYELALAVEPGTTGMSATDHGNMAWYLSLAGRHQDAKSASRRALELEPKLAYVRANAGLLHVRMRDLGKAMPDYRVAVWLGREEIEPIAMKALLNLREQHWVIFEAHYALGFCYEKKGDKAKAREHFQRYVNAAKEGKFVEEARKRVAELGGK